MAWIFLALATGIVALFLVGLLLGRKLSQHKTAAALKVRSEQGIVEERFVRIGSIEQWIGIRGENRDNPVLLIIHGGPGSSYSIFTPLIRAWESHFTVVQWDQPGSGKTFGRTGPERTGELTMSRLIQDGIEVAEYARARLRKDKIILLASSLGTTFGLSMVRRHPDLFSAYVGTDQNVGMIRDREANHRAVVERLRALGLKKGVAALEKIGPDPARWTAKEFTSTAKWTMKSDPVSYRQIMKLLKHAIWFSPAHTFVDIKHFVSGMHFSTNRLLPEIRGYDAWQQGAEFQVPFFIFQGENDVLTPPGPAKTFFDDVMAPVKNFSFIQHAGHFAAFTEPEQFLRKLLSHVSPMASTPSFSPVPPAPMTAENAG